MRRFRRPPSIPPSRPPKLDEVEATLAMLKVEKELGELQWRIDARAGMPNRWEAAERENPVRPRRVKMTLRLDEDVAWWFRRQGEGYQARVNAVLRLYMLWRMRPKPED